MIVFLDFEASSLHRDSYPIEVGWVDETGAGESHLIHPEEHWRDWASDAQSAHGLSQAFLVANGEPAPDVAWRVYGALCGHRVVSDAPTQDARWLMCLLATAGLAPLPVGQVYDVYGEALRPLTARLHRSLAVSLAQHVLASSELAAEAASAVRHRAESDARRLYETWLAIQQQVEEIMK